MGHVVIASDLPVKLSLTLSVSCTFISSPSSQTAVYVKLSIVSVSTKSFQVEPVLVNFGSTLHASIYKSCSLQVLDGDSSA